MNHTSLPKASVRSNLVSLDVDGDAVLEVEDQSSEEAFKFRIFTKVLCLASKVFAKMFGPDFEEGQRLHDGKCPSIKLEDDDPGAMHTILAALHYQEITAL
jgi:hypothetical protein